MTDLQWEYFCNFRLSFKEKIKEWNDKIPQLQDLQKQAAKIAETPEYGFENPIVYNTALDEISKNDEIKLIVIGDNPGKDEQLTKNQKYLVGQAGKLGNNFFKNHPELEIDFRKNVIILNKTPIHSAKTNQLKNIIKYGGKEVLDLFNETQIWMAQETAKLHINLMKNGQEKDYPQIWLVGYSELKEKGIFTEYKNALKELYSKKNEMYWDKVFVYQHFSMNRFSIDLNNFVNKNTANTLSQNLNELGKIHKKEVFE